MSEKQPQQQFDKCIDCPNRGRISKLLARAGGLAEHADDCAGPIKVSRGQVVTQLRYGDEPSPPQKTWSSMSGPARGSDSPRRYRRTDWTSEDVCGRNEEEIAPREGEVPYIEDVHIKVNRDGSRVAAFVRGDEEEISDIRGMQGIMELLDSAEEMVEAYNAEDIEGMQGIQDSVRVKGLSIGAMAGRGIRPGMALVPDEVIASRRTDEELDRSEEEFIDSLSDRVKRQVYGDIQSND